jgi:hypothetical protein
MRLENLERLEEVKEVASVLENSSLVSLRSMDLSSNVDKSSEQEEEA